MAPTPQAAAAAAQNLPLDDRSLALKVPIIALIVFSSIFVFLRLSVSIKNRNYFLLTDHLLWTGLVLAIAGAVFCYKGAEVGGGRHVWDPFLTPQRLEKYLYTLWWGQLLNLYGMALIKLSIVAYILMLDFSKGFKIVIWLSVVLHIGLNFVFPSIILLGECTPISKHWDIAGTKPGHCWSTKPKVISGYAGAATNIFTDLVYTLAPLAYIARVQLPKRTIWGVRAVFLLGLITTTISALKLYEMKSLNESPDPTYTSVNLSVFAIAEVFVGAFTASLPPLRKTLDNVLRKILPERMGGFSTKEATGNSYGLKGFGSSQGSSNAMKKSDKRSSDDGSEYAILPEEHVLEAKVDHSIVRTTHVSVLESDQTPTSVKRDAGQWA